jgi:hypothetical protein
MLPSAAICAFAIRKDVRDPILVGAMALAATAIPGYFVFWVSLYSQRAGHRFAFLIALAALVFLVISLRKLDNSAWNILRQVAMPFALVGAQSLFVLLAGFAYGGLDAPSNTAANRFSHGLPPDNELPFMVAEGIRKNYVREPMVGDWKSSDRPPLQSGVFLAHHPFTAQPIEIGYTVVSVILQSLWIPGLWLLLAAFRLNAKAIGLALVFCAFSGFVLVNTIFVWPKLLAAAYLLGVFALLFSGRLGAGRQHGALVAAVAGLLLALSLLSHGGTVFALIGGGAAAALFRTPISLKHLILVGLTSFLIYLPWIGYQKFYDPPGDRLLKYHLAGVEPVDPRPFFPTLQDAYGKLTLPQIVEHKTANFKNYLQAGGTYWLAMAELLKDIFTGTPLRELGSQAEFLRSRIFFYLFPALGLSALGLLGLAAGINRRFRSAEWSAAFLCWLIAALSISFWCVLMFGPNTTANHTGAYAAVLLAMAGGVLSLWTITPNIAGGLVYLQIALNALIYGLLMKAPFAGAPLTEGYVRPVTVAAAFCALSLDVFLFWKLAEHRPDPELGREALREAVLAQNALP